MRLSVLFVVVLLVNGCTDKGTQLFEQAQPLIEQEQFDEAAPLLEEAAVQGNAEAQYLLGQWYEEGIGVERDDKRSAQLYRSAADQSHTNAMYKLAESYVMGRGVEQNRDTATALIVKCAEMKNLKCMARLIMVKRDVNATESDISESLVLAEEVALMDYASLTEPEERKIVLMARANLSRFCLRGQDMEVDSVEALKWAFLYNENKSGFGEKSQENMFENIHTIYDHLALAKRDEAAARAEQAIGRPLNNLENLFVIDTAGNSQPKGNP